MIKRHELNNNFNLGIIDSVSLWNQKGREVPPVTREETRQGDREGITTHAVVDISAQDIIVGAVIGDRPT